MSSSIPFSLMNPGQVFACLGILELAQQSSGPTTGIFELPSQHSIQGSFRLISSESTTPVADCFEFLRDCKCYLYLPPNFPATKSSKCEPRHAAPGGPYPVPGPEDPEKPKSLPVLLEKGSIQWVVSSWADKTRTDTFKFWSGNVFGADIVAETLEIARPSLQELPPNPFSVAAIQSSSLRFDLRRDTVALDCGFSLNRHKKAKYYSVRSRGFPLVDALAVIGLSYTRPQRIHAGDNRLYRYAIIPNLELRPMFHRAALACANIPFPQRKFRLQLAWPGQPGKSRCISSVKETFND